MGICETKNNANEAALQQPVPTMNTEAMQDNSPMISLESIVEASKSICKIIVNPQKLSSGFLIQLFKDVKPFYCLMTNEHSIGKDMIKERKTISFYYNNQKEVGKIELNSEERFIKDFRDIEMDATVIEILPKDKIPQDYFLLPFIDYMGNYKDLEGQDIAIIQYPKGKLNLSEGKIKSLTKATDCEFIHDASTDEGSSGSPIFIKGTTKVVGIHKGFIEINKKKENYGDFIWPILVYFQENNINVKEINNKNDFSLIQDNPLEDKLNQMTITYEIQYDNSINSIRLFGEDFVKNNINNCYLLIYGKENKLCEKLILNQEQKNKDILEIKLIETNKITNMSYMFSECNSLNSLPDISKWKLNKNLEKEDMFYNCDEKIIPEKFKESKCLIF